MKKLIFLIGIIAITFTGCKDVASPQQKEYIKNKTQLFTQRTLWMKNTGKNGKNGKVSRTFVISRPFVKGSAILPINSEVVVTGFKRDIVVKYRGIVIKFIEFTAYDKDVRITPLAKQEAFDSLFQPTKVNLNKFTQLEQDNIAINEVVNGMSKEAVRAAIGMPTYPMTLSFNDNKWYYNNYLLVIFKDNKVITVKDNRVLKTKEVPAGQFK